MFLSPSVPTSVYSRLCRYCTLCCCFFSFFSFFFFFFDGRASPFHGSLIHFAGLRLPCQVFSFVALIGLKSIVRCCMRASCVHLNHLPRFISMAPGPNSSSGNDILPPPIFPVLLIGFSSPFLFLLLFVFFFFCPNVPLRSMAGRGGFGWRGAPGCWHRAGDKAPGSRQLSSRAGEQKGENIRLETSCTPSGLRAAVRFLEGTW